MIFQTDFYILEIIDEPNYSPGSADNARIYQKEYFLPEHFEIQAKYGIKLFNLEGEEQASLFITACWCGYVHDRSAVIYDDVLYLAIGNLICALSLPELELIWHQQVDPGSCFGIYFSREHQSLISHGEQEIACLCLNGEIVWSVSGNDIFTEGFALYSDHIEVIDFNHEKYRITIADGKINLIGNDISLG